VIVQQKEFDGVLLIKPDVYPDNRGSFVETYNEKRYSDMGLNVHFVQDSISVSKANVIRGLHYQTQRPQGKLVQVLQGHIFDVVVDLRENSPSFGCWVGYTLSSENRHQLYVPPGFAHGFCAICPSIVHYKSTDFQFAEFERVLAWNDKLLNISWPMTTAPILSARDDNGRELHEVEPVANLISANCESVV